MDPSNPTAGSNPQIPLVRVAIADLRQDPGNARSHDRRNLDAIRDSLELFGQVLPVVVRGGQIVGGNATAQAAAELGWTHLDATPADHLSEPEAVALAIALNRTGELADWDTAVLLESLQGLPTLEGTGYTAEELAELEAAVRGEEQPVGLTDPDEVPEPPVEPVTRPGDLWLLGPHRLACSDAALIEAVEALLDGVEPSSLVTDPPYSSGGRQDGQKRHSTSIGARDAERIARDNLTTRGYLALLGRVLSAVDAETAYVFTDWRMWPWTFDALESSGYPVRNMLVWDKQVMGMGFPWRNQHELIAFAKRTAADMGDGKRGNVLRFDRTQNTLNPTQKPVELLSELLANTPGDTVYDPFAGSGTTLMAAHEAGSRAFLMEIDAAYCDTIARRWQEHAGEKPILEATGEPHDFTSAL